MFEAWAAAVAAGEMPPVAGGGPPPWAAGGRAAAATGGAGLYELLEVGRDASGDDIKKAYRRLARLLHPDKNPGDAGAHARFLAIGRAYAVLGDEDARARYDSRGDAGATEARKGGAGCTLL